MLIAIDASRAFLPERTGTENYTWHLLLALAKLECEETIRLYLRPNQITNLPSARFLQSSVSPIIQPRVIDHSFLWTQLGLAFETWRQPPDVLFIPAHVIPFLKNPKVSTVVTVHDLPVEFFPRQGNFLQWVYLSRLTEWVRAHLATHIIAVSKATKKDLIEKLRVPEKKISVVYEGVSWENFQSPIFNPQKVEQVKRKYGIQGDYFLFVGTVQPRKNLVRLFEAFKFFLNSLPNRPPADPLSNFQLSTFNFQLSTSHLQLVIVGKLGWDYQEILAAPQRLGIAQQIKFLDYVPDQDLPALYAGSIALVLPSLHEGFGLPVLEAYAAGTLVVCSNVSSLPEVGGPLAIYVDPYNISDIARGLGEAVKLRFNPISCRERIAKQRNWAKQFSWQKAAAETLRILRKVATGQIETAAPACRQAGFSVVEMTAKTSRRIVNFD